VKQLWNQIEQWLTGLLGCRVEERQSIPVEMSPDDLYLSYLHHFNLVRRRNESR
jgi:hypothetical protein